MIRFDPVASRRELWGHLVWFFAWLGVTAVGFLLTPSENGHGTHQQLGLPPCPSVIFFERPCPGCGLTTSWTATLHGQLVAAFSAHNLGPLLYALFTASAFACAYGFATKKRFDTDGPAFNRFLVMVTIAFFVYGIARMALVRAPLRYEAPFFTR
jgi:hypothetical protein